MLALIFPPCFLPGIFSHSSASMGDPHSVCTESAGVDNTSAPSMPHTDTSTSVTSTDPPNANDPSAPTSEETQSVYQANNMNIFEKMVKHLQMAALSCHPRHRF